MPDQKRLGEKFRRRGIPLIAEKVETHEQFDRGRDMGYQYFQGYFFCRPEMLSRRGVPANKAVYLQLLCASTRAEIDLNEINRLIKQEVSLSYRLLRYLNSPLFGLAGEIHSIIHALNLLGERAIRKWISLVSVAAMGDNKPAELVRLPLVRARFCELLAEAGPLRPRAGDLFLVGLLSLLEPLLGVPLEEVLNGLPVDKEIKNTLRGFPTRFSALFNLTLDYETGSWEQLPDSAKAVALDEQSIPDLYSLALSWADDIISRTPVEVAK